MNDVTKTEEQKQAEAKKRMEERVKAASAEQEKEVKAEKATEAAAPKTKAAPKKKAAAKKSAPKKAATTKKAAPKAKADSKAKPKERGERGPSLKLIEYEPSTQYNPPRDGTKAQAVINALLDRKGATLKDIQDVLKSFDETTPHDLQYCRTWLAKSYLGKLFGLGLRTKVVKVDGKDMLKAWATKPKVVKQPVTDAKPDKAPSQPDKAKGADKSAQAAAG